MGLRGWKCWPLKSATHLFSINPIFCSCETWVCMALWSQKTYHWKNLLDIALHSSSRTMTRNFPRNFRSIDSPWLIMAMTVDDGLTVENRN